MQFAPKYYVIDGTLPDLVPPNKILYTQLMV
jgi:hypothetical protein